MAVINVSLPDVLKNWIEAQIKAGHYASASDYVRSLIRRDLEAKQTLVEALELGATSGVSKKSVEQVWRSAKKLGCAKI